jgi:hypothetical protein
MSIEPSTSQAASSEGITALFETFSAIYGARFADMWAGSDANRVRQTWGEALYGYTGGEVKAGVRACRTKPFPPTLPEFLLMCRPPVDFETAFIEAVEQSARRKIGTDRWSSKAVFWAAMEFGGFDLERLSWSQAKPRWSRIYASLQREGDALREIPPSVLNLSQPGKAITPPEAARGHLSKIKALVGLGKS